MTALLGMFLGRLLFNGHFHKHINYVMKSATSRSTASIFRVLCSILASDFSTNSRQLAVESSVALATRQLVCLAHVIDFLRYLHDERMPELGDDIVLGIVDAFDELQPETMENYVSNVIAFFSEACIRLYQFCQPRVSRKSAC